MRHRFFFLTIITLSATLFINCSKNDDQRQFEQQARSQPQGITQTDAQGNVMDADPDDWRISPMYRGLVSVGVGISDSQPPYPNPMQFNQTLNLSIYVSNTETLDRIEIFTFEISSQLNGPIYTESDISSPQLVSPTNLNGEFISSSSGGSQASGLYRLLIYDGQQNLITYGDVRIQ
jgi:hypothetical protein